MPAPGIIFRAGYLEKLGHDPVVKVLELKPKLMGVLERVNQLIGED